MGRRTQWIDRTTLRLSLRGVTDWAGRPVIDEDNRDSQLVEESHSATTSTFQRTQERSSEEVSSEELPWSSQSLHRLFTSSSRDSLQRVFTWSSEGLHRLFTSSSKMVFT